MTHGSRCRGGRLFPGSLWLVLPFLVFGCGPPVGHVSGKVTFKGQPLPGGTVTFYPTEGSQVLPATAQIHEDGTYDMTKAPLGPVKVAVDNKELKEGGVNAPIGVGNSGIPGAPAAGKVPGIGVPKGVNTGPPKEALDKAEQKPPTYQAPAKAAGKYVPIDTKYVSPETSGLTCDVKRGTQTYDIELK